VSKRENTHQQEINSLPLFDFIEPDQEKKKPSATREPLTDYALYVTENYTGELKHLLPSF